MMQPMTASDDDTTEGLARDIGFALSRSSLRGQAIPAHRSVRDDRERRWFVPRCSLWRLKKLPPTESYRCRPAQAVPSPRLTRHAILCWHWQPRALPR